MNYSAEGTGSIGFMIASSATSWALTWLPAPAYILSIFLLSSWANEKMIRTITNKTTTMFLSDKIGFIITMIRWCNLMHKC